MNHGTTSTYKKYGCRCDDCQTAYYLHKVKLGRKVPRLPVEPIVAVMTDTQKHLHKGWIATRRARGVALYDADKMCISLGIHPMCVYGDLWLSDTWGKGFANAA